MRNAGRASACPRRPRHARGLTLLELMTVVALLAVFATLAVPAFARLAASVQRNSAVYELVGALNLARSEAIKRRARVTLCKTPDPDAPSPQCQPSAAWNQAWLLFVDNADEPGNSRGLIDGSDQLLRVYRRSTGLAIATGSGYAGGISYRPNGVSQGLNTSGGVGTANGTFTLCAAGTGKKVVINLMGRVRVGNASC